MSHLKLADEQQRHPRVGDAISVDTEPAECIVEAVHEDGTITVGQPAKQQKLFWDNLTASWWEGF